MLLIKLLRRLLVVKFWRNQLLYVGFLLCRCPSPLTTTLLKAQLYNGMMGLPKESKMLPRYTEVLTNVNVSQCITLPLVASESSRFQAAFYEAGTKQPEKKK